MDRILKALKDSIVKWEEISTGNGFDTGYIDCPLCKIFHNYDRDNGIKYCNGCPIKESTGQRYCMGTPYMDWFSHTRSCTENILDHNKGNGYRAVCPECKRIAKKMTNYIKEVESGYKGDNNQKELFEKAVNLSFHIDSIASAMQNPIQDMLDSGYIVTNDIVEGRKMVTQQFKRLREELDRLEEEYDREYKKYI